MITSELILHAYDWEIKEEFDDEGDPHTAVHAWCLDRDSKAHLLRINTFPCYCYVELPMFVNGRYFKWDHGKVNEFMTMISATLGDNNPISWDFDNWKKIYYYRPGTTYPMIRCQFRTLKAMNNCARILEQSIKTTHWGFITCKVHELDITIIRKLLAIREVGYSAWFRVNAIDIPFEASLSTITEHVALWETMVKVPAEECVQWTTSPSIVSFDIECYTDNKRAMPDHTKDRHCVYLISVIYQRLRQKNTRKRYAVIFGDCNEIPPERLEHCEIIRTTTELSLVKVAMGELIQKLDPDILTGYNILGFDYYYLNGRLEHEIEDWPAMGRIKGERATYDAKEWSSGAYGHQRISMVKISGRISVDLLPIIRREYKLDTYGLGVVSTKFLGKTKHDIKPAEMFAIYERFINAIPGTPEYEVAKAEMTRMVEYCIQDAELVVDLFEELMIWDGLVQVSNIVGVTIVELFTRGQQIRCVSQLYELASKMGFVLDHRDTPGIKFSGGFVFEPVPDFYKNIISLDAMSLYPSLIQAYNFCYTTLVPPELENQIPDEDCHVIDFDQTQEDEKADDGEESDRVLTETNEPKKKKQKVAKTTTTTHYHFKFIKKPEGLLPRLVRFLVERRNHIRNVTQKQHKKGSLIWQVLEKTQLGLKVSANSFFGFLGIRNGGKMPLIEGAMSITAKGRELIGKVGQFVTSPPYNGRIIYGDTDSCMFDLGITDASKCHYWGVKLMHAINGVKKGQDSPDGGKYEEDKPGLFLAPLKMDFEKAEDILCFKKKKYAALLIKKDGTYKRELIPNPDDPTGPPIEGEHYELLKRGIVIARRDNCKFLFTTYTKILMMVLLRKPLDGAVAYLDDQVRYFLSGQITAEQLALVRSLGASYKNPSYFMKVFADRIKRAGKIVNAGDRLTFVIVQNPEARLLGEKLMLLEDYLEGQDSPNPPKLDYDYYLEKTIKNSLDQLFEVGYKREIGSLAHIMYKETNRHKSIGITKPLKLMLRLMRQNYDIGYVKYWVANGLSNIPVSVPAPKKGTTGKKKFVLPGTAASTPITLEMLMAPPVVCDSSSSSSSSSSTTYISIAPTISYNIYPQSPAPFVLPTSQSTPINYSDLLGPTQPVQNNFPQPNNFQHYQNSNNFQQNQQYQNFQNFSNFQQNQQFQSFNNFQHPINNTNNQMVDIQPQIIIHEESYPTPIIIDEEPILPPTSYHTFNPSTTPNSYHNFNPPTPSYVPTTPTTPTTPNNMFLPPPLSPFSRSQTTMSRSYEYINNVNNTWTGNLILPPGVTMDQANNPYPSPSPVRSPGIGVGRNGDMGGNGGIGMNGNSQPYRNQQYYGPKRKFQ